MDATGDFELRGDIVHAEAQLSEVTLHYVEAGDPDGKLVILLHGFPEFWYSWRHQIPVLARAGYRVIVPDQRGYTTSSKPQDVMDYGVRKLVGDVVELIDFLGADSAILVGHDWGGIVAWFAAMMHPDKVDKLAILNVPHPIKMWDGLRTFKQMIKSWYIAFFQVPWVAEKGISASDFRAVREMFRGTVNDGAFDEEEIELYVRAIADNDAISTMLNWYRASARDHWKDLYKPIEFETLVIWGTSDVALGEELAEPPSEWVPNVRVEKLDASHWVQCDVPTRVNALLLHYLAES